MIDLPKISIVTPSFNQAEFLEECIGSILSQNYPNLEYIIIDGGSTDNSVEIIRKYEKHLAYWVSEPDRGQYDAINKGFGKTTSDIMAWLNSDDMFHYQSLFKVAFTFMQHDHVQWISGRQTWWDEEGNVTGIMIDLPLFSRRKYMAKQYDNPWIQQESTFWRRSLWEKAGGFVRADLDYAGDLELWTRFFRHAQLYTVDAPLGGYRQHDNQKMALHRERYIVEAERILDAEISEFSSDRHRLLDAPPPLKIDRESYQSFIDSLRDSGITISSQADRLINYLMHKVQESDSVFHEQQSKLQSSLSRRFTAPLRRLWDAFR
jgi:glycosyltransferase involved in cell wall biosynthesis